MKNNPNFISNEVAIHQSQLKLINSLYDGFDTAKDYIIQYTKESDKAFATRKELSRFSNYIRDAVTTTSNMVLRKPTDFSEILSSPLGVFLDTIDLKNKTDIFLSNLINNIAKDGYTYLLVEKQDYNDVVNGADETSKRPYLVNIQRSIVRNFKQNLDGSFRQFTFDEPYTIDEGYEEVTKVQQRCYLEDGTVEIWRDDKLFQQVQNGLRYIPVIKIGIEDISRFYDLAVINRNHLNLKSEQRYYARICASPIPTTNMLNKDGDITIGVTDGINFDSPTSEASFQWVELSGKSNEILENLILKDEDDMKKFILSLTDGSNERTAKEVSLLNINNESTLNFYAGIVEDGLNKAFEIMAEYQGIKGFKAKCKVNRDFIDNRLTPEEISQYKDLYINGVISHDIFLNLLINGEILPFMDDSEIETMKVNLIQND